jgi:hypothetical protein
VDVLYGCLGVATIILALGFVTAIPGILGMIERVTLHDPSAARRASADGPLGPPDSPWGRRP